VFRWIFAPRFAELGIEEAPFIQFLKQSFAQKRKTLANNLRASGKTPESVAEAFSSTGISPLVRAEALPVEQLAALWRALSRA
jgi:16S rRNA (adenine1518-N6/adenine1519-N6)-dimethyltransferase